MCRRCEAPCVLAPSIHLEGIDDGLYGLVDWEKPSAEQLPCYAEGVLIGEERWRLFVKSKVDHSSNHNGHITPEIVGVRVLDFAEKKSGSARRPNLSEMEGSAKYEMDEAIH